MKKGLIIVVLCLLLCGCGPKKNYYCLNGELDGDECIISTAKEAYGTCREGYTKVGYVCRERVEALVETTCDEGFYGEGGVCLSEQSKERDEAYSCEGINVENMVSIKLSGKKCSVTVCTEYNKDGDKCLNDRVVSIDAALVSGDCPKGTREIYGECKVVKAGKNKYSCPSGQLSGKYCLLDKQVGVIYTCNEGEELVGYECISQSRVPAKVIDR